MGDMGKASTGGVEGNDTLVGLKGNVEGLPAAAVLIADTPMENSASDEPATTAYSRCKIKKHILKN